jgi:hypothetical protein
MRKRLALILLSCILCMAATAQQPTLTVWWPAHMAPSMRPSLRSIKLIQKLNPANIFGTVIIVPLVNIASFEQKVPPVNPADGKSRNRASLGSRPHRHVILPLFFLPAVACKQDEMAVAVWEVETYVLA